MSRPLLWKSASLRAELIRSPLSRAQMQLCSLQTNTGLMQTHGATATLRLNSLLCENEIVLMK